MDGTTGGQTAGGYTGTVGDGYKINFMIVHPSAVTKVVKHVLPRIFTPNENQKADAWKFDYRMNKKWSAPIIWAQTTSINKNKAAFRE